jgi:hypothetical protein
MDVCEVLAVWAVREVRADLVSPAGFANTVIESSANAWNLVTTLIEKALSLVTVKASYPPHLCSARKALLELVVQKLTAMRVFLLNLGTHSTREGKAGQPAHGQSIRDNHQRKRAGIVRW